MGYDDWKTHDPRDDEPDYNRMPDCATPGCLNRVTFPDREAFCSACLADHEYQRRYPPHVGAPCRPEERR